MAKLNFLVPIVQLSLFPEIVPDKPTGMAMEFTATNLRIRQGYENLEISATLIRNEPAFSTDDHTTVESEIVP